MGAFMIRSLMVVVALTSSLVAVSVADARGGCGVGLHRGPAGGCRLNGEHVVVVTHPVVVAHPVVVTETPRPCPRGFHLGPRGHRCFRD